MAKALELRIELLQVLKAGHSLLQPPGQATLHIHSLLMRIYYISELQSVKKHQNKKWVYEESVLDQKFRHDYLGFNQ